MTERLKMIWPRLHKLSQGLNCRLTVAKKAQNISRQGACLWGDGLGLLIDPLEHCRSGVKDGDWPGPENSQCLSLEPPL